MVKKWTPIKFIAIGGFSALLLIALLPGAMLNAITGSPNVGGPLNAILYTILIPLFILIINQVGAGTVILSIFSVLALPFPLIGTPGLFIKIPILLIAGILIDIFYRLLNKRIFSVIVGGFFLIYVNTVVVLVANKLNIPGQEFATKFAFNPITLIGFVVIGLFGGWISNIIFNKIKNTSIVKRIQK